VAAAVPVLKLVASRATTPTILAAYAGNWTVLGRFSRRRLPGVC
jgi:hypothetical protein